MCGSNAGALRWDKRWGRRSLRMTDRWGMRRDPITRVCLLLSRSLPCGRAWNAPRYALLSVTSWSDLTAFPSLSWRIFVTFLLLLWWGKIWQADHYWGQCGVLDNLAYWREKWMNIVTRSSSSSYTPPPNNFWIICISFMAFFSSLKHRCFWVLGGGVNMDQNFILSSGYLKKFRHYVAKTFFSAGNPQKTPLLWSLYWQIVPPPARCLSDSFNQHEAVMNFISFLIFCFYDIFRYLQF